MTSGTGPGYLVAGAWLRGPLPAPGTARYFIANASTSWISSRLDGLLVFPSFVV